MSRLIPCKHTTEGGMVPYDQDHHDFVPAMTVKANVDAAISLALSGDSADAALDRLLLAANALRGVRSIRISGSWHKAIVRVQVAICAAYELAA